MRCYGATVYGAAYCAVLLYTYCDVFNDEPAGSVLSGKLTVNVKLYVTYTHDINPTCALGNAKL